MNETPSAPRLLLPYFLLAVTMAAFSLDAPARLSAALKDSNRQTSAAPRELLASSVDYPVLASR